jgi:hypothetical protein
MGSLDLADHNKNVRLLVCDRFNSFHSNTNEALPIVYRKFGYFRLAIIDLAYKLEKYAKQKCSKHVLFGSHEIGGYAQ